MSNTSAITVATLWRYPVKSMMGEELNGTHITMDGVLGDRSYALVDTASHKVISAKTQKMARFLFISCGLYRPSRTG